MPERPIHDSLPEPTVQRGSFRAVLRDADTAHTAPAFAALTDALRTQQAQGYLLTASLYRCENQLFLYAEWLGAAFTPAGLAPQLDALLIPWPPAIPLTPGTPAAPRLWAEMQPYYYHAVPGRPDDWMRDRRPEQRRGRIALLPADRWCSYMEHHLRLVSEGKIAGDRRHLICVHENVLFSYFEEPRSSVNLCGDPAAHSDELDAWLAAGPESHFAAFTQEQRENPGRNFVFLERCAGT